MNKQISTALGLAIIIIFAAAVGFFIWKANINEPIPTSINQAKKASEKSEKDKSKLPANGANPSELETISNWQLVSGDPSDTCTKPTFKGEATVKGWYAYEDIYVEQKDWVFNVIKEDVSKLPQIYDAYNKKYLNIEKFRISDATPALQVSLKKYTKENPGEITIKSYWLYCEGLPSASVSTPAENQSGNIYQNTTYGFQITLPDEWKNFKVDIDDKQIAETETVYIHFLIPTTDKTFPGAILKSGAKLPGYVDVFAISVWKKSRWDKDLNSQECKTNPSPDCPYEGSILGKSDKYVFDVSHGNGIFPDDLSKKVMELFATGSSPKKNFNFQLIGQ